MKSGKKLYSNVAWIIPFVLWEYLTNNLKFEVSFFSNKGNNETKIFICSRVFSSRDLRLLFNTYLPLNHKLGLRINKRQPMGRPFSESRILTSGSSKKIS